MKENNKFNMKWVGVFVILSLIMTPFALGTPDLSCLDSTNILLESNITIATDTGELESFVITSTERCEYGCVDVSGTVTPTGKVAGECSPSPVVSNLIIGVVFFILLVIAFVMDRNEGDGT